MNETGIDYAAVFQAVPGAVALFTPDVVYADANREFLEITERTRDQVVGRFLLDVFPYNPLDPSATGVHEVHASVRRVVTTGRPDTMPLLRYDVQRPDRSGVWEERYWSPTSVPVFGPDGDVALVLVRVEEVTDLIHSRGGQARAGGASRVTVLEAELYTRARELQELNERLLRAHAREREVALTLQRSMLPALPALPPVRHRRVAVRYRPAVGSLNVCGDWYDLIELPGDRITVAVGDVVGQGLSAAGVMGQLRSALSAAARVADGPARALGVVGRYAHSVDGAESATAVNVSIDWDTRLLVYSSAGHLPPALVHRDGTVTFLDQATDPPLAVSPEPPARPEADAVFGPGGTLVLYTDGLVERRHEDIDEGLGRLADSLVRHRKAEPETLADAVLTDMIPPGGATDDIALLVVRL